MACDPSLLANLTWPGAIAVVAICGAVVGVAWAVCGFLSSVFQ